MYNYINHEFPQREEDFSSSVREISNAPPVILEIDEDARSDSNKPSESYESRLHTRARPAFPA